MSASTCILVLGMHRSGTSALTGCLQLAGVELGPDLMPGREDANAKGYFEHQDIYHCHRRLLGAFDRDWDDPRPMPPGWVSDERALAARDELSQIILRDFSNSPLWAFKDPRTCRLLPLWLPLLESMHIDARVLVGFRHPAEVVASLAKRDQLHEDLAFLLWTITNLELERDSRSRPRVFCRFDTLLNQPKDTLSALAERLQLSWPTTPDTPTLRQFLDPTLRRQVSDTASSGNDLADACFSAIAEADLTTGDSLAEQLNPIADSVQVELGNLDPALLQQLTVVQRRLAAERKHKDAIQLRLKKVAERVARLEGDVQRLQRVPKALRGLVNVVRAIRGKRSG